MPDSLYLLYLRYLESIKYKYDNDEITIEEYNRLYINYDTYINNWNDSNREE